MPSTRESKLRHAGRLKGSPWLHATISAKPNDLFSLQLRLPGDATLAAARP
jgi:hypothetical protein